MLQRPTSWSLALVSALATCVVAGDATACLDLGDPCQDIDTWTLAEPVFHADIPTDGMLLVRVSGPSGAPPMIEFIDIAVTLDGTPVTGALEEIGVDGVLGWRPAAPLVASSQYVVVGTIHNVEFLPGLEFCGEEFVPFEFEFGTAAVAMPPLQGPDVSASVEVRAVSELRLDALVCCDGAFPHREWTGCGSGPVQFDEGFCIDLEWTGRLEVVLDGLLPKTMLSAPMFTAELVVDGVPSPRQLVVDTQFQLRTSASQPICTGVVLRNFVSGAVVEAPGQCHGQDLAGQLGPQVLAPDSPQLVEGCMGTPYVCEVDESGDAWDPDRCVPWPEGQTTTGAPTTGGATSGGPTSAGPGDPGEGSTGTTTGTTGGATSPGDDGLVAHGCACNGNAPSAPGAWMWLLALAGLRRTRRRV